jgi:hypothetical protein
MDFLGYLEYSGKSVEGGLLDARKSAQALLGFDEAVRYFVGLQEEGLQQVPFEIPVRIKEGSWLALIPSNIGDWVTMAIGVGASAYVIKAAKTMAENDFRNVGLKTTFQHALKAIQWAARIGIHLGDMRQKKIQNPRWRNNNKEIGIPNAKGELLFVPIEYFKMFELCPPGLLSKMSSIIEIERKMSIAVITEEGVEKVAITESEKGIFCYHDEDEENTILPELKHGDMVTLEGIITRGNENTNSIGLFYKNHVLNCVPKEGSIVRFKWALFLKSKVTGRIDRLDKLGGTNAARPRIIVETVSPSEEDPASNGTSLFHGKQE